MILGSFHLLIAFATLHLTVAQIKKEDLPKHLQYLFEGDLDVWVPPSEISKKYPYYLSGFDDENRPVWVLEFGKFDFKAALEAGGKYTEDFRKYVDQSLYNILVSIGERATSDEPQKDAILIADMDGFNVEQLTSPAAIAFHIENTRKIFQLFKYMNTAFVINVNYVAQGLLNLVRPLYGQEFVRLDIYGTNPAKWKPALLKKIPRDQLPEWYGGSSDYHPVRVYG